MIISCLGGQEMNEQPPTNTCLLAKEHFIKPSWVTNLYSVHEDYTTAQIITQFHVNIFKLCTTANL